MNSKQNNLESLALFQQYIIERKQSMKTQYRQLLADDLSRQQWDGCFQRNVLAILERTYRDALNQLQTLPFDSSESAVNRGLSELTQRVLTVFDNFVDEFLLFAVDKHRTSCALSNFPDEHKPDNTYVNEVKREAVRLWQDFAINANAYFLERR